MMTKSNNYIKGLCVSCKKSALGQYYNFIRKDVVDVKESTGILPGERIYKTTYIPTKMSSFVCQHCIRHYFKMCISQMLFSLFGLGFTLFLTIHQFPDYPELRFLGLMFSIIMVLVSLNYIGKARSADGVQVAIKQAKMEWKYWDYEPDWNKSS
jgi:hypothetical protein